MNLKKFAAKHKALVTYEKIQGEIINQERAHFDISKILDKETLAGVALEKSRAYVFGHTFKDGERFMILVSVMQKDGALNVKAKREITKFIKEKMNS